MLSRIFRFGHKKQAKKIHVSDSDDDCWLENFHLYERGLPGLERSQIRLLVYKDHDKRGDKLVLFDSKTDLQDDMEQQDNAGHRPVRKRVSSDVQLLGEMIFGSVEMTYKGPTVKAHSMRSPPQLLLTKVFALKPPRASHLGSSPTHPVSNSSSEYSSSVRFTESISSVSSVTSPVTSSDNEDSSGIAKSIPFSNNISWISSSRSFQLQNMAEGFANSMSVDTSRSLTFPRASASASSSYQRRWLRSQVTRMDYGCMRRNDNFSSEMSERLRRRPKIGIGILFSLWEGKSLSEENNRLFQNFVFSHFPLFESHIHRLKRMVEKALLSSVQMSGKSFQDALFNAANTFASNILNLYYAPRIRDPLWLTMLSQPNQCNSICDDLVPQIVNAVELYNTKQTNYFLASLLTAVLTYHVAWVNTVTPSSELARRAYLDKHSSETLNVLGESHPYNPLWAQLSELYGACGDPTRMARTVLLGQDQHVVTAILHILSYFIRCSEVFERSLDQAPKNLVSHFDTFPSDGGSTKENFNTISEKCEDVSTCCSKDSRIGKNSENLSQNSKSYVRDSKMYSEDLVENPTKSCQRFNSSKFSTEDCKRVDCCDKKSCKDSKCLAENMDSCREDSGICIMDLESSVEVPSETNISVNDVQKISLENSRNCLQDFSQDPESCFENSEKISQHCEDLEVSRTCSVDCKSSENSEISTPENTTVCPKDSCSTDCVLGNCKSCNCKELCEQDDLILKRNSELCNCDGVFAGNNKEHKLWKSFLKSSRYIKNSRSLDKRSFSEENMKTKVPRRYSSEKGSECHNRTKLCVQNDGKIFSLDRENILDMFLISYPFCPVCKRQLSFVDLDLAVQVPNSACLCAECDKLKPCSCQVVNSDFGENGRCASSFTVNSDGYCSGLSLLSLDGERGSLSSLDSGLNEQCLLLSENLDSKCFNDEQIFVLELPNTKLDANLTEDDLSSKNAQDCQLFSFGRSLMAGYCDQYVPDFVLHGTDRCTEEQMKQSIQISLEQPVVDSPVSESVIIMGDTDKWECTIKTLSKHRKSIGNQSNGVRSKKAERSTLVHDLLTSFCNLWKLNMPATFCLMHLEDKMKELYLRSKVVSEYLLTQKKYITRQDLMSTFGYGECDLALIMSIIGVHSPLAVSQLPLS